MIQTARLKSKITEFRGMVTVEPCIAIFLIGMSVTGIANQNLLLDKACRVNLGHNVELCDALIMRDMANSTIVGIDTQVQKYVTRLNSMGKFVQIIIPFCVVIFWGLWSDRNHLRKPLIYVPLFGEVLKNICLLLCVYFEDTTAEIAFIVENIFPLIFGNWVIIIIGVFSHIMDTTTIENRTTKVAFNNIFVTLGDPIGSALSGVLLRSIGYYGVFSISAALMFIGMLFCIYGIEEGPRPEPSPGSVEEKEKEQSKTQLEKETPQKKTTKELVVDFFNFKELGTIFRVFTRKRVERKRLRLFLSYILLFFGFGPMYGAFSVNYLFTRHQFNYSEIEYSIFGTLTSISGTIGLIIIMFLNYKFFKLNDYGLQMIGLSFGIASSIFFALSKVSRDFYIAGAIDSGFGVFGVALRAALMKVVDGDEAAKSNAIIGALEGTIFPMFATLYNFVYNQTMDKYAGAFYFMNTGCFIISLIITCTLYFIYKAVIAGKGRIASQTTLDSTLAVDEVKPTSL